MKKVEKKTLINYKLVKKGKGCYKYRLKEHNMKIKDKYPSVISRKTWQLLDISIQ